MRYHWVGDRVRQGQFDFYWREGGHNLADYFTKDLFVAHHKAMRHFFVTSEHINLYQKYVYHVSAYIVYERVCY